MLRVMVVDDEPLARRGMRQLLARHAAVEVVGEAGALAPAVDLIHAHKPDAVFLDVEMRGDSGFDLLAGLDDRPDIVFVTAHSQYAVKAYDFSATDYLLKPVDPERLASAIAKLERAKAMRAALRKHSAPTLRIKTHRKTLLLRIDSIVAMLAEGDYTRVYAANSPAILAGQSLGSFEAQLPGPTFLRLDRSLIINTERAMEIERTDRNTAYVRLDGCAEKFALGRAAAARVRKLLPPVAKSEE